MNSTSFPSLFQNIALLLALVLIFDTLILQARQGNETLRRAGTGLLIGCIGLVIMLTPWVMVPGVIFDTRSVLLCVSGLFFGAYQPMLLWV